MAETTTCPVCKQPFDPKLEGELFCGGGHCSKPPSQPLAAGSLAAQSRDALAYRQLRATHAIAILMIYSVWSGLAIAVGAFFVGLSGGDGGGVFFGVVAVLGALWLAISGIVKASEALKESLGSV